jgi:hypothetical protein
MRKTRTLVWLGVVAIAVAIGIVLGPVDRQEEPRPTPAITTRNEPAATGDSPASSESHESVAAVPAVSDSAPPEETVTAQTNDKTFRVNDSERLVLDEQTRLNMEALFARTEREHLAAAKQQAIEPLPASAAAQAAEEAALAELDGLHALRVSHFGPLVARALYGEEEATSRQLVELMRLEKDQSLTLEEKAARAQQLHDSMRPERR